VGEGDVARPQHVRLHQRFGPLGVAVAQRAEDLAVVLQRRLAVLPRVGHVGLVDQRDRRGLPDHRGEQLAVGGFDDLVVEGEVLLDQFAQHRVVVGHRRVAFDAADEFLELLVGQVGRRAAGRVALEDGAQRVHLAQVLAGEGAHRGGPVRRRLDQALAAQQDQRLADRGAADPELFGEQGLAERLPGAQLAREDRLAQHPRRGDAGLLAPRQASSHRQLVHGFNSIEFEGMPACRFDKIDRRYSGSSDDFLPIVCRYAIIRPGDRRD
jgi:hypothetical protein